MEATIRDLTERVGKLEVRVENTEIDIQELQDEQSILQTMSNNIAALAESDTWLKRDVKIVGEKVDCLVKNKVIMKSKVRTIVFSAIIGALCSGMVAYVLSIVH